MPSDNKTDSSKLDELLGLFDIWISHIIADGALLKNEQIRHIISEVWQSQLRVKLQAIRRLLFADEMYRVKLEDVGLAGDQLNLKFVIFNGFISRKVSSDGFAAQEAVVYNHPPKAQPITKRFALGILEFFNSLLGSLADVIPMAESIKEFKDMIHFEVEYGADFSVNK